MKNVYISGALRTPLGTYRGSLADFSEQQLAAMTMLGLIEKTGVPPAAIDEIIIGNARQTSTPSNLARHAQLEAELPVEIPAYTVQRQSASGLQAIVNGYLAIRSESAEVILAGGSESMSRIPLEIRNARYAFGPETEIVFDPIANQLAGAQPRAVYGTLTAEAVTDNIADKFGVAGEDAGAYLDLISDRAAKGRVMPSVLPVEVKRKKSVETVAADQCYDEPAAMARPADGAAVCLLCSEEAVRLHRLPVQAELLGIAFAADAPGVAGSFEADVITQVLSKAGVTLAEIDYFEITEFSAVQMAAAGKVLQDLGMTGDEFNTKVNSAGGTLITGLAWGACGAVLLTDLIDKLDLNQKDYGMLVTPAEGGQTLAAVVKRVNR